MKSMLLIAAIVLAASPAAAAAMRVSQAMTSQGQNVVVEGTAHVEDEAGAVNVELTDDSKGHLVLNIPMQMRSNFPDLASYNGKTVEVRGIVEIGARGAQITINRANQLKLAAP